MFFSPHKENLTQKKVFSIVFLLFLYEIIYSAKFIILPQKAGILKL